MRAVLSLLVFGCLIATGCIMPIVNLGSFGQSSSLREVELSGSGKQKLVLLSEEMQRYATGLRGLEEHATQAPQAVWDTAGLLRAGSPESAMTHLSAQGVEMAEALVLIDAARMLNTKIDKGRKR